MKNRNCCPNVECQSPWGIEEQSFQECDSCGWPNVRDDEEEEFDFYDDDEDLDYPFDPLWGMP